MGFLSKLFSHKSVEEVADEIANTYAEEVQAVTAEQTDTAGAETEQVNMLEVSDTGEIEYTEKAETDQGESPPQEDIQTADPSEVRRHIITFRVNDAELAAINRRYEQTSFKKGMNEIWQLLTSIRYTKERTIQLLISSTRTKPETAGMLLATCAYLLHREQHSSSEKQGSLQAQDDAEPKHST